MIIIVLSTAVLAQPAPPPVMREKLVAAIERTAREFDGAVGVAIRDLKSNEEILINEGSIFPTGSSIKIAILIELHKQAAAGELKLTETLPVVDRNQVGGSGVLLHFAEGTSRLSLHDLSVLMIALSDNSATNMLIDRLGMGNINKTIEELGLKAIRLQRKMIDLPAMARGMENVATPRAAATMMAMLAEGRVISPEVSNAVLKTLRIPKVSPIPRLIPSSVSIANKPGGVEGVACDWALVDVPNRPFAIAVMTAWNGENAGADEAIAKIARSTYDYFAKLARSTQYGARVPLTIIQQMR